MKFEEQSRESNPDVLCDSPERYPLDHNGLMKVLRVFLVLKLKIDNRMHRGRQKRL